MSALFLISSVAVPWTDTPSPCAVLNRPVDECDKKNTAGSVLEPSVNVPCVSVSSP